MTDPSSAATVHPHQQISPEIVNTNNLIPLSFAQKIIAARNADIAKSEHYVSADLQIADLKRQLQEKDELITRLQAQLEVKSKSK